MMDIDIEDELSVDEPILFVETPKDIEPIQEESNAEDVHTIPTKKRQPTQYNIFIKETMLMLASTRPDLIGKERFKYAVLLWNEKKKNATTSQ